MTDAQKEQRIADWLKPETVTLTDLLPFILMAQDIVLNKRFPFGYDAETSVPTNLENIQCQIALELWNKRGAEGQTSSSENGITRTWANSIVSPTLLNLITPCVGSVVATDEND